MLHGHIANIRDAIDQAKEEAAAESRERIKARFGSMLRGISSAALKAAAIGVTVLNYKVAEAQVDPMHLVRVFNDDPVLASAAVFSMAMGGAIYLTLIRKD